MDDSDAFPTCGTCFNELHTITRPGGKTSLECTECGPYGKFQPFTPNELVADFSEYQFAYDTNYATSTGRRGNRTGPSQTPARKEALDLIDRLCQNFNISAKATKDQMKYQFSKTTQKGCRPLTAYACAAFLSYTNRFSDVQITLSSVASFAGIKPEEILKVQKKIEELITPVLEEAAKEGALLGEKAIALPQFQVTDETGENITQKIRKIAGDIIRVVVQELKGYHWNTHFAPIAAACLAYQSFFLHKKDQKGENSREVSFVKLVGQTENLKIIHEYSSRIIKALLLVGDKMSEKGMLKKVPKNEGKKRFVLRNLQEILKQDKEVYRWVLEETNNAKREEEPAYEEDSVSEEELTKEEEEQLAAVKLCDKDLSDAEFESYMLSPDVKAFKEKNVIPLMDEYEEKRASKKRKRVENQDDDTEVDSDDDEVYEEEIFDD